MAAACGKDWGSEAGLIIDGPGVRGRTQTLLKAWLIKGERNSVTRKCVPSRPIICSNCLSDSHPPAFNKFPPLRQSSTFVLLARLYQSQTKTFSHWYLTWCLSKCIPLTTTSRSSSSQRIPMTLSKSPISQLFQLQSPRPSPHHFKKLWPPFENVLPLLLRLLGDCRALLEIVSTASFLPWLS